MFRLLNVVLIRLYIKEGKNNILVNYFCSIHRLSLNKKIAFGAAWLCIIHPPSCGVPKRTFSKSDLFPSSDTELLSFVQLTTTICYGYQPMDNVGKSGILNAFGTMRKGTSN